MLISRKRNPVLCQCKVLEKHIRQLMEDHLNETGQLSRGFRSKRSTVSALVSVTYDWISVLETGDEVP